MVHASPEGREPQSVPTVVIYTPIPVSNLDVTSGAWSYKLPRPREDKTARELNEGINYPVLWRLSGGRGAFMTWSFAGTRGGLRPSPELGVGGSLDLPLSPV